MNMAAFADVFLHASPADVPKFDGLAGLLAFPASRSCTDVSEPAARTASITNTLVAACPMLWLARWRAAVISPRKMLLKPGVLDFLNSPLNDSAMVEHLRGVATARQSRYALIGVYTHTSYTLGSRYTHDTVKRHTSTGPQTSENSAILTTLVRYCKDVVPLSVIFRPGMLSLLHRGGQDCSSALCLLVLP